MPTLTNMTPRELRAWAKNPRHRLASTATGHASLRRLPRLLETPRREWTTADHAFARKVDAFIARHSTQAAVFGHEVARSGYSRRHIALMNWGHNPSKPSSPLRSADRHWLNDHPGAAQRRHA